MPSVNTTTSQSAYAFDVGTVSTSPFVDKFEPRDPTPYDRNYATQKKWLNTSTNILWELKGFDSSTGYVLAVWIRVGTTGLEVTSITTPDSVVVLPVSGNINLLNGTGFNITGSGNDITIDASPITIIAGSGLSGGGTVSLGGSTTLSLNVPITVPNGGTGATSFTSHGLLVGEGTSAIQSVGVGGTGTMLVGQTSSDPVFASALEGSWSFNNTTSPGSGLQLTLENTNNTSVNEITWLRLNQGGTSAGFVAMSLSKGTTASYSLGMTSGASTNLVINTAASANVAPTTGTTVWQMTQSGQRTLPLQPAFEAYNNTPINSVTGDSTNYTIQFNTVDYDIGGNFSSPSFTAPVAGQYFFTCSIIITGLTSSHTSGQMYMGSTSGEIQYGWRGNPWVMSDGGNLAIEANGIFDMLAGQSIALVLQVSNGAKVVNINGGALTIGPSSFQGVLLF